VICGYTEDWYMLTLDAPGRLALDLTFDAAAAAGDLDLSVVSPAGDVLADSATEASPESVVLDASGQVFIRRRASSTRRPCTGSGR
jgi:Tfp pilus assembly protein PilW